MLWLFNNTGKSLFAVALFHMTINVTWHLFPLRGSYSEYRVTGFLLAAVTVVVLWVWGPTFTRQAFDGFID